MPEAEGEELDTGKIHILQLHQCGVGRIKIQTTFSKNIFPLNSEIHVYYMRNLIRMFLTHLHLTHQSVSSEELFDVQEHFRDFFLFHKALFLEIKKAAEFVYAKNQWTRTPEMFNFVSSRFYIQEKQL